jgi:hypothetical protein
MPKTTPVQARRTNGDVVGTWESITQAARQVGCSESGISYALRVDGLTAGGYLWQRWTEELRTEWQCSRCRVYLRREMFRWIASPISGNPVRKCYCKQCESRKAVERARRKK